MCCLYYFDKKTKDEVQRLVGRISGAVNEYPSRDIHPSDPAPVVLEDPSHPGSLTAETMWWGFLSKEKKLLINARSESAAEKPSFSESLLRRRCIIPAARFYEWNTEKEKYTFYLHDRGTMYMAGLYDLFPDKNGEWTAHYTILTREANQSMAPVHDRMPLILEKDAVKDWILKPAETKRLLANSAPLLVPEQEYRQLSLF